MGNFFFLREYYSLCTLYTVMLTRAACFGLAYVKRVLRKVCSDHDLLTDAE